MNIAADICHSCQAATLVFEDEDLGWMEIASMYLKLGYPRGSRLEIPLFSIRDWLPDLPTLSTTSDQKRCEFCAFLRDIIRSGEAREVLKKLDPNTAGAGPLEIHITLSYLWKNEEEPPQTGLEALQVRIRTKAQEARWLGESAWLTCLVESEPASPDVTAALGTIPPSPLTDYSDRKCIDWMQERIAECEGHLHALPEGHFVPRRLLDLRGPIARLVDGKDIPNTVGPGGVASIPSYTALSYCWGSREEAKAQLKSTSQTLHLRQAGVTEGEMTSALRDAVHITRALGIPYLWIDALCVLQGNISDWEMQCPEMEKIYGNARVVLFAAASRSCQEGFLKANRRMLRVPIQSSSGSGGSGSFVLRHTYASMTIKNDTSFDFFYSDLNRCRWGTRGWVYHERLQSTRGILFGPGNLHFICDREMHTMGKAPNSTRQYLQISEIRSFAESSSTEDFHSDWDSLIADFSSLSNKESWSVPTDVFPALSGIASVLKGYLNDEYLAGMWKGNLLRSLIWWPGNPPPTLETHLANLEKREDYFAPSWSWASSLAFKGRVSSMYNLTSYSKHRPAYLSLDGKVTVPGLNPFGKIQDAVLEVTTRVIDIPSRAILKNINEESTIAFPVLEVDGRYVTNVGLDWDMDEEATVLATYLPEERGTLHLVLVGTARVRKRRKALRHGYFDDDADMWDEDSTEEGDEKHETKESRLPGGDGEMSEGEDAKGNESRQQDAMGRIDTARDGVDTRNSGTSMAIAYGLVVCRLQDSGNTYRVGIFLSEARSGGGVSLFDGCNTRAIKIF